MKKTVYTLLLFALLFLFCSAIHSYKIGLPDSANHNRQLILPKQTYNYNTSIPVHILDFLMGWKSPDPSFSLKISDEGATLGRVLFYDKRLSQNNQISCGTCHQQAFSFSDQNAVSTGINGKKMSRNTLTLNDLGWQLGDRYFWDFRAEGLEQAILTHPPAGFDTTIDKSDWIEKISADEVYPPLFEKAFGNREINEEKAVEALVQFIQSMNTFDSKYDRESVNNYAGFSKSEKSGLQLFDENCGYCHISPHFGSTSPTQFSMTGNNGLDSKFKDKGMGNWKSGSAYNGYFKSPSLRNVAQSSPYMHDGRFETLDEVLDFYSEGIQQNENSFFTQVIGKNFKGFQFTDQEKENLLSFLNTLTDPHLLTHEKWSDPWLDKSGEQSGLLKRIEVYPNPVRDIVVVELDKTEEEFFVISIFDITGKLVNSYHSADKLLEIPRGNSPTGVYQLVASSGQQQVCFKLVYR